MTQVPPFLYGTAWKEERTESLVRMALENGFRGIDTANQRKHYFEEAVGLALKRAVAEGLTSWDELFIQTKFTHLGGQDHRLPYDPSSSLSEQVRQSWKSSLEHLQKIDSLVLHGPTRRTGLGPDDIEAWEEMVRIHREGEVAHLGLSNVSAEQVTEFCALGTTPHFVQNRCYARLGWDAQVREVCRKHGITYQGFSLLTANIRELDRPQVVEIAKRRGWSLAQLVFCFSRQVGMLPLTGTSNAEHMRQDLAILDQVLEAEEFALIASLC